MSIRVKSFLKDVGGAGRVTEARREKLKNASAVPDPKDPIRDLADKLHPSEMQLRVTDIRDASPTAKTFRFEAVDGHIPVFQCGQFVNFRLKIGESLLTRPYTISSAPYEARGEHPFFEITVRRNVPYLVPDYFFENVHVGDVLTGALPFGTFYWEPLRDTTELVALAGGSGITPFYAMAKEIAHGKMHGCRLTILYGSVKSDDIVLKDELDQTPTGRASTALSRARSSKNTPRPTARSCSAARWPCSGSCARRSRTWAYRSAASATTW